jgi:hypothetical protein
VQYPEKPASGWGGLVAVVKYMDRPGIRFAHATPSETGRPAYDPGELLRLYIHGYLSRHLLSSRSFWNDGLPSRLSF